MAALRRSRRRDQRRINPLLITVPLRVRVLGRRRSKSSRVRRGYAFATSSQNKLPRSSWQARIPLRLILKSRRLLQLVIRWLLQLRLFVIGRFIVAMGTTHWKGYGRRLRIMVHWATRMAVRWQMVPVDMLAMGLVLPHLPVHRLRRPLHLSYWQAPLHRLLV